MHKEAHLLREAERIDQQLRSIRRALLRAYMEDSGGLHLTAPQLQALNILSQSFRENRGGMTVRDLSERMGLAQSTVSGVVERLEGKKLVTRQADPSDRRCTRITLTEDVKAYLGRAGLQRRLSPLVNALQRATGEEREAISAGLSILQRLLTAQML